jgi:hypothetical protein
LLEQADALMRRNRGRADAADIPVLTDVVTGLAVAAPPEDVPVLTDVVEKVVVDIVPLPAERFRSPGTFEGDPSDWLVADTVDPAMHSITGRAPDTLSVVPAVTLKAAGSAATPPPEASQRGLREVASAREPGEPLQGTLEGEPPRAPDAEEPSSREVALSGKAGQDEQAASDGQTQPSVGESAEVRDSPLQLHWPREEFEPRAPDGAPRADETGERPSSEDEARSGGSAEAARSESPVQPPHDLESQPVSTEAENEEERWRALAEQISQQVLQRIDLFTDTGLKDQLAAHLQPIVALAGAELVSAINVHVGRLLRAYVAEAIEREIAQWRDSQR